tara:strand:- start:479 stop:640 length:162 start_codon:yes stop_codon:yes gene_type:complete
MPKEKKLVSIKEIRMFIESNIKCVSDVTASRIYEVMTGHLATTKTKEGIRLIT